MRLIQLIRSIKNERVIAIKKFNNSWTWQCDRDNAEIFGVPNWFGSFISFQVKTVFLLRRIHYYYFPMKFEGDQE